MWWSLRETLVLFSGFVLITSLNDRSHWLQRFSWHFLTIWSLVGFNGSLPQ